MSLLLKKYSVFVAYAVLFQEIISTFAVTNNIKKKKIYSK